MRSRWQPFALVVGLGVASIAACSRDEPKEPVAVAQEGDGGAVTPSAETPATRAEFGLDSRPANTTCLAPSRPPAASGAQLVPVFGTVTVGDAMAMAQAPGDKTRWFIGQRQGKIVSFPVANPPSPPTLPALVADVTLLSGKPIYTDFEGGFLGMAFHPDFAQNGRLYVSFTTAGTAGGYGSEVGYLTSTDKGASFTTYTRVLLFDRAKLEHCGGGIAFGNQGLLYLSFGDGTVITNAQQKTSFFGKVLRIDPRAEGGKPYRIPADNPFVGKEGVRPEIWAYGVRNPWRFSFGPDGTFFLADVGQNVLEEVNAVSPAAASGANYGWAIFEGDRKFKDGEVKPGGTLVEPALTYPHDGGACSVTGGGVYAGSVAALRGRYLYADFCSGDVWAATVAGATLTDPQKIFDVESPASFGVDDAGEMYVVSISGPVHRITV